MDNNQKLIEEVKNLCGPWENETKIYWDKMKLLADALEKAIKASLDWEGALNIVKKKKDLLEEENKKLREEKEIYRKAIIQVTNRKTWAGMGWTYHGDMMHQVAEGALKRAAELLNPQVKS